MDHWIKDASSNHVAAVAIRRRLPWMISLVLRLTVSVLLLGALFHFSVLDPTLMLGITVIYLVVGYVTRPMVHGNVEDRDQSSMARIADLFFIPGRFITEALTDGLALIGIR